MYNTFFRIFNHRDFFGIFGIEIYEILDNHNIFLFLNLEFFSIALHAQVAVVTKAKLDEVSVKGDCKCDGEDDTVFQQFLITVLRTYKERTYKGQFTFFKKIYCARIRDKFLQKIIFNQKIWSNFFFLGELKFSIAQKIAESASCVKCQ